MNLSNNFSRYYQQPTTSVSLLSRIFATKDDNEQMREWMLKKTREAQQKACDEARQARKQKQDVKLKKEQQKKIIEKRRKIREQQENRQIKLYEKNIQKLKRKIPHNTLVLRHSWRSPNLMTVISNEQYGDERVNEWMLKKEKEARKKYLEQVKMEKKIKEDQELKQIQRWENIQKRKKERLQREKKIAKLEKLKRKINSNN